MVFNSLVFVVFATIFFAGWWLIRQMHHGAVTRAYLAGASLTFYAWWNWRHVFVLVAVVLASYAGGLAIARWRARRSVLVAAILAVLAPLLLFKYADFVIVQVNALVDAAGIAIHVGHLGWSVPIGISFFTLSAISYAIDVYTDEIRPSRDVVQHGLFLAMFPLLLSGPIVRGPQLLAQIAELPPTTRDSRWQGTKLITFGLVKKCIVADTIAKFTSQMYDLEPAMARSAGLWWLVAFLFAIQLYCDFSGYTDIAIGLGRWMGFELPDNFLHPFRSTSFREFWSRWNISFSAWLRDYIYFPLARRWEGRIGAAAAVMLTFFVSGLWHGAAWTFVSYGLVFGLLILVESWTKWDHWLVKRPGGRGLATAVVFVMVSLAFVLPSARSVGQAWSIYKTMFSFDTMEYGWIGRDVATSRDPSWVLFPILFVIVEARNVVGFDSWNLTSWFRKRDLEWVAIAVALFTCVYARGNTAPFIYAGF
jgi:alginate O-acetyltransferase complex protein AlgI